MKRFTLLLIVAIIATTNICSAQSKRDITKQVNRIDALIQEDRFIEIEYIVDSMLSIYQHNSDMLHLKAVCHSARQEYNEAIECYNRAIDNVSRRSNYTKAYLLFCRGALYDIKGECDVAIEDYNQAMDTAKKNDTWLHTRVLSYRARSYFSREEYDKAEQDLMTVIMTTDEESYIQNCTRNLCDLYIATAQYYKATLAANRLLEMDCHHYHAYRTLAIANIESGHREAGVDNAIMMAKTSIMEVEYSEFRWMLWRDVEHAREKLHESIAEDVNNEMILLHLIIAETIHDYEIMLPLIDIFSTDLSQEERLTWRTEYAALAGKYDEAVRDITTLMEGKGLEVLYNLTDKRCDYYRLAGEYEEALADAERLIELVPEDAYGYYQRGWIYELMGNDEAAMENYNRGIEVDNSYAYIYLMRGEQYLKYGDTERAKADFERVLELDTEVTDGSCRHYALHFLGRDNEALVWMEHIIVNNPYDYGTRYDEACLHARMGNVERALDALHMALYLGYKAKAHIENDDDLDPIRHTEVYQRLMEEYFNE